MPITYRVNASPEPTSMRALWRAAWGSVAADADWSGVLARSLCWVTAHADDHLIGFVNVAWDGGVHAFLLDTTVHPGHQRRGIGQALVRRAAVEARARGAHWLHVDFEPHLEGFYATCGFSPTRAGLIRLGGERGMTGGVFSIRSAQPRDNDALYRICLETGDSGADATPVYRDPLLIGHIWAGPYLALEPQFAFVLEDDAGVCGYVIGAPDTAAFEARLEREWWPTLRAQYPDPVGVPPAERTPDERLMHRIHHPPLSDPAVLTDYPSHLHIDLLPRGQGGGNGRRLMERLFAALRDAGSPGVHLGVGVRNERAQGFYRHLGMQELERDAGGITMGLRLRP